jgi:antitoxin (DNA-binding transcriptional repressor) of toxin-antitoxin stability system
MYNLTYTYLAYAHMKATIVDLRYRMSDVLKALERNEDVNILYHGRLKGILTTKRPRPTGKVAEHAFFNMRSGKGSVDSAMEALRSGRYRDL